MSMEMQQETIPFQEQIFEARKLCPLCEKHKPVSQFYNWSGGRKSPYCKVCENKETRKQTELWEKTKAFQRTFDIR